MSVLRPGTSRTASTASRSAYDNAAISARLELCRALIGSAAVHKQGQACVQLDGSIGSTVSCWSRYPENVLTKNDGSDCAKNTLATSHETPTARTGGLCMTPKLDPLLGLHFRNVLGDALRPQRGFARRLSRVA